MTQKTNVERGSSEESLQPFSGRILLGICFESGHSIWLYDFESTPTELGAYREFWVIDPDDTRTLNYDTEGATAEIESFHKWSQAVFAEMAWEWTPTQIDITVTGSDGTTIELTGEIGDSVMSCMLMFM